MTKRIAQPGLADRADAREAIVRLAGADGPPTARYYGAKRSGNAGGSRGVVPPGPTRAPPGPAQLRAAKRLTKRAFRQRERAFLAEGPQAVAEALRCGAPVTDLFVTVPARSRHIGLVTAAEDAGVPVHVVSGEVMEDLAQTVTPQGLLAVCAFVDVPLAQVVNELKGRDIAWTPREPKGAAPPGLTSEERARREGGASRAPGGEREDTE